MELDFKTIPMELVINIANIVILFVILRMLVYKPVKKFMDKRSERIAQELQEAKEKHDQAEEEQKNMSQMLSKMEQSTTAALKEKQTLAMQEADSIVQSAKREAVSILHAAREQANEAHRDALVNMKVEVAKLSVDIAEKLLARELQQKDNEELVNEFFEKVS